MTGYVHNITVDDRSYCAINKGKLKHYKALNKCKKLNARLPLPRNRKESDAFRKIMGRGWAHADVRNPLKAKDKSEWIDAEDEPIGKRDVFLWGLNENDNSLFCSLIKFDYRKTKVEFRSSTKKISSWSY